ncbi:MAG: hypothetical protein R3E39_20515 [Anaerolineae bacterium]
MLRFVFLLIVIFSGASLTARALGGSQPPGSELVGFTSGCEGLPQPCWYGVVPGITTVDEANRLWAIQGYTESADGLGTLIYWKTGNLCSRLWVGRSDNIVMRIGMPLCNDIRLGYVAMQFDNAFHIVTQSGVTLLEGQVALAMGAGTSQCIDFNPFGRVAQIWMSAESEVRNSRPNLPLWRGYQPFNHYQRDYHLNCIPFRFQGGY